MQGTPASSNVSTKCPPSPRPSSAVPLRPPAGVVRLVTGLWLLLALILVTVYRSNLKAMLILPKVTLPFDNLAELVQTDLPVWVATGSVLHDAAKVERHYIHIYVRESQNQDS